jgi:predicted nucleic acid-binding protein
MNRFFIIDTNVVVAGLLTSHADSPVARILDGMLAAAFPFVLSEALLSEYRAVLVRPHLVKMHQLNADELDTIMLELARHAIVLTPAKNDATPKAPDPGGQFLWDLLSSRDDLYLVTGDKLLLQDHAMHDRVLTPNMFVDLP